MIHSAHDLLRVRLCQAAACTEDAEQDAPLCRTCAQAIQTLQCSTCRQEKNEDDYPRHAKAKSRFGRAYECRACQTTRRRARTLGNL